MRRRCALLALTLTFGAAACDDDNVTGPSNTGPIVFTAELRASNEVPTISNAESSAVGTVTITFNVPRDGSGVPSGGGTWNVQAVVSGFTNDSFIRAAHIHNGAAGVNAGIFVDTRLTAANQIPLPGGSATINFEGVDLTQSAATAVLANPAGHYFNMHSPLNPGGAIRGQLVRVR